MAVLGGGAVSYERGTPVTRVSYEQAAEHCGQIEAGDLLSHVDSLDIAKGVGAFPE